jgi:hypothetical protein
MKSSFSAIAAALLGHDFGHPQHSVSPPPPPKHTHTHTHTHTHQRTERPASERVPFPQQGFSIGGFSPHRTVGQPGPPLVPF